MNYDAYAPYTQFYMGLDLGQSRDFSALVVVEMFGVIDTTDWRVEPKWEFTEYRVRHIHRYPLGTAYPRIAHDIVRLQDHPNLRGKCELAVDYTGVGRAVVDILKDEGVKRMTTIAITGGDNVNKNSTYDFSVPKRELLSTVHALFHAHQIRANPDLPFTEEIRQEIGNFGTKINNNGHITYEALLASDHDDLVISLSMACWLAEYWRKRPRCTIFENIAI